MFQGSRGESKQKNLQTNLLMSKRISEYSIEFHDDLRQGIIFLGILFDYEERTW